MRAGKQDVTDFRQIVVTHLLRFSAKSKWISVRAVFVDNNSASCPSDKGAVQCSAPRSASFTFFGLRGNSGWGQRSPVPSAVAVRTTVVFPLYPGSQFTM